MMITVENDLVFTENLRAIWRIWMMLPFKHSHVLTDFDTAFSGGSKLEAMLPVQQ